MRRTYFAYKSRLNSLQPQENTTPARPWPLIGESVTLFSFQCTVPMSGAMILLDAAQKHVFVRSAPWPLPQCHQEPPAASGKGILGKPTSACASLERL
jgi:hypothetical protein